MFKGQNTLGGRLGVEISFQASSNLHWIHLQVPHFSPSPHPSVWMQHSLKLGVDTKLQTELQEEEWVVPDKGNPWHQRQCGNPSAFSVSVLSFCFIVSFLCLHLLVAYKLQVRTCWNQEEPELRGRKVSPPTLSFFLSLDPFPSTDTEVYDSEVAKGLAFLLEGRKLVLAAMN